MNMVQESPTLTNRSAPSPRASGSSADRLSRRLMANGEFLTFRLGQEEYGIDILKVQEIRSYEAPTRIANAPPFLKGVVNCAASSCRSWTCASSWAATAPR